MEKNARNILESAFEFLGSKIEEKIMKIKIS